MVTDLPRYSIIIPAYNAVETLERCLSAVTQQDYPPECYEVVVIDDGSADDTASIAKHFPVRLIQLETNQGRIVARNTGAHEAVYDKLVFVDTRVLLPFNFLKLLAAKQYLPLMPHVFTKGEGWGWFNRLFSLIRQQYYRPRPPLTPVEAAKREAFFLTADNFARAAKGTTTFACSRNLWLACQPEDQSKHGHDDTPILQAIVQQTPIMQCYDLAVTYLQRERLLQSLRHLFLRGPRFASHYLQPGHRYYKYFMAALVAGVLLLIGLTAILFLRGWLAALIVFAGLLFIGLLGCGIYLARRPSDVLLVMVMLLLVGGAFGAGILWGLGFNLSGVKSE